MQTVVLQKWSPEMAAEVERRRAMGADLYDEMWDGEYVMAPMSNVRHGALQTRLWRVLDPYARAQGLEVVGPFNLGTSQDFRCPDLGVVREVVGDVLWVPTAALVVEVLSKRDRAWQKLGFYAAHGVEEVVIVDPADRTVAWLAREGEGFEPTERSALLDVAVAEVVVQVDWA